jgi:segregation and condensation protein B
MADGATGRQGDEETGRRGDGETSAPLLDAVLECFLFVSPEPVTPSQVAAVLEIDERAARDALEGLRERYPARGLQVLRVAGGYQLCTRPEHAEPMARFLRPPAQRLSRPALETLAVIAYRQPVTQPELEAIRGVNSTGVVKTLLERGLIVEKGRKETVGRPILYVTTDQFLKHFGLKDLTELPLLEESLETHP